MLLVPYDNRSFRLMMFIDGQALAAAYARLRGDRERAGHVEFDPDGFAWSDYLNLYRYGACNVAKRFYYTSSPADAAGRDALLTRIQNTGIQAVRIFRRPARRRRSPVVATALSTELLSHAQRGSFEAAVLVAGSAAYVPVVDAAAGLGRRIYVWFFAAAVSAALRRRADHFFDVGQVLFMPTERLAEHFA